MLNFHPHYMTTLQRRIKKITKSVVVFEALIVREKSHLKKNQQQDVGYLDDRCESAIKF